jgi:endonuclease/exonuclease/phosphatase family metal-dependent hydrolase
MKFSLFRRSSPSNLHTIAFYNLENLFDTYDGASKRDKDYTPNGLLDWGEKRYKKKVLQLAMTIAEIGRATSLKVPTLVGIAEVENKKVLNDLLRSTPLQEADLGFVHYDSPDERGIDTALLYDRRYFEVLHSEPIALHLLNWDGQRENTRDILYVHGNLNGEAIHIFVNHWPSRRDGTMDTDGKRIQAADTLLKTMNQIQEDHENPNYIVMGDFNDNPTSRSIKKLVETNGLYNPMEKLHEPSRRGSTNHRRSWFLFDQIILSHNFLNLAKRTHSFDHANIFDDELLKVYKGKYKGSPLRTYSGRKYLGGQSDHFPVYIQLKYQN